MPTYTDRRRAALALGLFSLALAGPALADEPPLTAAAVLASVAPPSTAKDADLAVESAKLSAALQKEYAGRTLTLNAGVIIQIITEGGGVKIVSFPTVRTDGAVGRSLCHATLKPDQEADGKKLSPGDSATLSGRVVSVSAKVEHGDAATPVTQLFFTMEDVSIVSSVKSPRAKAKKPAATQAVEPMN